ncbi:hypothetical protein [Microvirga makkahensis]|uniref:hypothetical protein n=1 Tax=Microvirga makkahensis TaxID=1128670 RepID=UPI00197C64CA|nr:hypothetical protein [Microvirga makkahensis]
MRIRKPHNVSLASESEAPVGGEDVRAARRLLEGRERRMYRKLAPARGAADAR